MLIRCPIQSGCFAKIFIEDFVPVLKVDVFAPSLSGERGNNGSKSKQ